MLHFLACIKTPQVLLTQHVLDGAEYIRELTQHALAGAELLAAEVFVVLRRGSALAVLTLHVLAAVEYFATGVAVVLHFLCCIRTANVLPTKHALAGAEHVRSIPPACVCWC